MGLIWSRVNPGQVDGNVHRLLSRLLALHAPPTSPALIKALWASAEELVQSLDDDPPGLAGDLNQVRSPNWCLPGSYQL
jgi:adenine-specific DNA glycosylase